MSPIFTGITVGMLKKIKRQDSRFGSRYCLSETIVRRDAIFVEKIELILSEKLIKVLWVYH